MTEAPGNPPRISVVIPALDEAAIIRQTLLPLQAFRNAGVEVIVIDGGSIDATVERAQPLADQVAQSAPGRAAQMNCGWSLARGAMVWFVHADTGVDAQHLESLLAVTDGASQWGYFALRIDSPRRPFRVIERAINLRSRLSRMGTGDQALFVSRELLEATGGYADLPLMEDLDLCLRLRRRQPPVFLQPPVLTSARRWEKRGLVRTVLTMWLLRGGWRLGLPPRWLARWYGRVR